MTLAERAEALAKRIRMNEGRIRDQGKRIEGLLWAAGQELDEALEELKPKTKAEDVTP